MHGGLIFGVSRCFQLHQIEHGQHPNIEIDIDGWTLSISLTICPFEFGISICAEGSKNIYAWFSRFISDSVI